MKHTWSVRGLELTRLALGGAQFGSLYRAMSDAVAEEVFRTAWERGVRYVDTAPHYGLGLSERRLGRLLRQVPRDSFVLSTKVGRRLVTDPRRGPDDEGSAASATVRRAWDFSREGIRRSLEESLERLGLDRVDVVYLHDAESHWPQALAEAVPALVELRDEGTVGAIGAGVNVAENLTELVLAHDVDLVMCAGRYTLLEQADGLMDVALRHGVGVVVAGVYSSGLLARPRPGHGARYTYEPAPQALVRRVEALADVCGRHGVPLPDAALAFVLRHPAVASVAVGASRPEQIAEAADRLERPVPQALWDDLVAEGLLVAHEAGSPRAQGPDAGA